jgi:hypothetical protein
MEQMFGDPEDPDFFKKIYYLCIFKIYEDEPDILKEKMTDINAPKNVKKFVFDNLNKYPTILNHEMDK